MVAVRRRLAENAWAQIGSDAIAWELSKLGVGAPCTRTIERILARTGTVGQRRRERPRSKGRALRRPRARVRVLPQRQPPLPRDGQADPPDEQARKAAAHNATGRLPFEVETDPAFAGYIRRLKDEQPYSHWAELMLAGIFQARFFQALAWVRGQLIHAATVNHGRKLTPWPRPRTDPLRGPATGS